jgi:hypothetical protein
MCALIDGYIALVVLAEAIVSKTREHKINILICDKIFIIFCRLTAFGLYSICLDKEQIHPLRLIQNFLVLYRFLPLHC